MGGWSADGFGLPNHNNSLESDNRHGLRKFLKKALDDNNIYVPGGGPGLIVGIECLFDHVLPSYSKLPGCNSFEEEVELEKIDYDQAHEFLKNKWFLELGKGVLL